MGVDRGDAAATGADTAHVDRGQPGHVAAKRPTDPAFARARDAALSHQADIERRTASIGDDHGFGLEVCRGIGMSSHWRHRGAGIDELDGCSGSVVGIQHAGLRGHHQHPAGKTRLPQPRGEAPDIPAHQGLERRIDGRGGRPTILAQARVQAMRKRIRDAWQMRLDELADPFLVRRLDDRPEQADGDRIDLEGAQSLEDGNYASLVERRLDRAVGHHALGHLEGQTLGHVGLGIGNGEVEDIAPPALAKDQDVGMAARDEECRSRRVAGQDRVNRMGRAVDQQLALLEQFAQGHPMAGGRQREAREHALDRIIGCGRSLVDGERAIVGLHQEIGERAPGVDRKTHQ